MSLLVGKFRWSLMISSFGPDLKRAEAERETGGAGPDHRVGSREAAVQRRRRRAGPTRRGAGGNPTGAGRTFSAEELEPQWSSAAEPGDALPGPPATPPHSPPGLEIHSSGSGSGGVQQVGVERQEGEAGSGGSERRRFCQPRTRSELKQSAVGGGGVRLSHHADGLRCSQLCLCFTLVTMSLSGRGPGVGVGREGRGHPQTEGGGHDHRRLLDR